MDQFAEEIISTLSDEQVRLLRMQYLEKKIKGLEAHPEIPPMKFYTFIAYWKMEQVILASMRMQEKAENEFQEMQESLELDEIASSHDILIKGRGRHHRQLLERFDRRKTF